MSLKYRITKRTNTISTQKETKFIMQAVTTGTIDLDRISYEISNECTLSEVDVKAVLIALGAKLQQHLAEGKIVDLDHLGKYKIGFKGIANAEASKLSTKNIKKYYLNFQPSLKIKHWLKKGIKVYKEK